MISAYTRVVQVPIFPLNAVLFPDGPLPLRVFEPRYLDMVSRCLKTDQPFGVLLIRDGNEVGMATTYEVGTLARISDWYQGSDGILGVTAIGEQRFRMTACERQSDGLNIGDIELLESEPFVPLPEHYQPLKHILANVLDDLGRLYESQLRRYDDASWLTYRFLEVLPIDLTEKQKCLEEDNAARRLRLIGRLLNAVREPA